MAVKIQALGSLLYLVWRKIMICVQLEPSTYTLLELKTCQLLFASYKVGHKGDIHKNIISLWIRKLLPICT